MKKILKYFVLIFAASLIAANFASASNQLANLQESFEKIKESVQEVKEGTKNLITTKEEKNLSPEEKEKQELSLRLEIFGRILNLSAKEAGDTINQLKSLNNLEEKISSLRNQFIAELERFLKFYDEQKKLLEKPEEIDLAKIKEMAQSFKGWREKTYLPEFNIVTNFLLINQQKATLEMTRNRFNKISSDVAKLEKINFKGTDELKKSLSLAADSLKKAKDFRQEAEDKFLMTEEISNASSTTASSTNIDTSTPNTTSTEETVVLNITVTVENASSTTASSTTATSTPSISIEDQFLSIKGLIGDSLNKIKETYQIFIEMSNFVKKLLI